MATLTEIAQLTQFNAKAEAQAISDYTTMIAKIMECDDFTEEEKKKYVEVISELTADELNHSRKLDEMYVDIMGIQPKKE